MIWENGATFVEKGTLKKVNLIFIINQKFLIIGIFKQKLLMMNYKTHYFAIIIQFFISFLGFGQTNKMDIQVEGGPSLISVYGNFIDTKPTLNGFTGGLYINYNINKRLSIKSGIVYERKGFRDSFNATLANGSSAGVFETGNNLDYLVMPLLIRANYGNNINFFVNGGPYLGYLANQQSIDMYLPLSGKITGGILTEKKIDFGISAGMGFAFPINDLLSISFEARNNLALISLVDGGKISNNSTNFILGITYHLKD